MEDAIDISELGMAILTILSSGPRTYDDIFSRLAEEQLGIDLDQEVFSSTIGELEEQELIVVDFRDNILWSLTDKGRELFEKIDQY